MLSSKDRLKLDTYLQLTSLELEMGKKTALDHLIRAAFLQINGLSITIFNFSV